MKKDFLLEILVQELPYKFIPSAICQLKEAFKKLFRENGLEYGTVDVYATPRRLAVIVKELSESQQTIIKDAKGPILNIAKDSNGNFTPAAIGFAKKNNVDVSELYEKDNYIRAKIEIKGKNVKDVLKNNVQNIILKMQGSHFMRWGEISEKFSRPIENIVAIYGNEIVDLCVLNKKAGNITKGHRFSKNLELTIDEPKNYIEILKTGNVIVNQDERQKLIIEKVSACANENNLSINFDNLEDLLEEITFITEWPVAVLCEFDEKYLKVPDIVTTTVMTSHQRYFPLYEKDGTLSNKFITVANYVGDEFSNIRAGNLRVIAARLEDGIFFFEDDTKTKLIDKLDELKGMTFQKGLGTLFDKTQRMIKLSSKISDCLEIKEKEDILRCATLAKCDLSTKLVFEFTELQGFIGENYALISGEKPSVAKGIKEHYFPLNATSDLPSETIGQVVSIADKIDTICALFISTQENKKKRPTGSNDPLGARRSAIGIIRTILEYNLSLDLEKIIKYSLQLLSEEFNIKLDNEIESELKDFFISRLIFMEENELSIDSINAVQKSFNPMNNITSFIEKVKLVESLKNTDNFNKIKEVAIRTARILKDFDKTQLNPSLFVLNEEKELYQAIINHKDNINYKEYVLSLNEFINPSNAFFDKVLVMDKNENIKNNRLTLLNLLNDKFKKALDFNELQ